MTPTPQREPAWRVASKCNNGSCVAVAALPDGRIGLRDTKDDNGPILSVDQDDWEYFLQRLKKA
ncbi:DUF397 domain-containing protein [Nonomuraea soli]|uniref:DUF397 domain-containing protein n=1 Tax=Nonomuraea soli TaxID=1032476 RepID=A0A7W0CKT2_9ACTN|nr:DUF397 domain-containing protein [Nonomuraea soli]MBA2892983.1 hypothetical protein [Nonomuraea soli]